MKQHHQGAEQEKVEKAAAVWRAGRKADLLQGEGGVGGRKSHERGERCLVKYKKEVNSALSTISAQTTVCKRVHLNSASFPSPNPHVHASPLCRQPGGARGEGTVSPSHEGTSSLSLSLAGPAPWAASSLAMEGTVGSSPFGPGSCVLLPLDDARALPPAFPVRALLGAEVARAVAIIGARVLPPTLSSTGSSGRSDSPTDGKATSASEGGEAPRADTIPVAATAMDAAGLVEDADVPAERTARRAFTKMSPPSSGD